MIYRYVFIPLDYVKTQIFCIAETTGMKGIKLSSRNVNIFLLSGSNFGTTTLRCSDWARLNIDSGM